MTFTTTELPGAFVIDPERIEDERGFFARTFSVNEFEGHGLNPRIDQCSVSYNRIRGTLRGMHFQAAPHAEAKLVRCVAGAIHDVIIDLRPGSPTFRRWIGVDLSARNRRALYVPEGFAHGFLTLEDDSEVFYQISQSYVPGAARGVRWDDPAFGIRWPGEVKCISARDRDYADFQP
jgi:dTDP-4-dehydrorhamnose 3,5-epimerase